MPLDGWMLSVLGVRQRYLTLQRAVSPLAQGRSLGRPSSHPTPTMFGLQKMALTIGHDGPNSLPGNNSLRSQRCSHSILWAIPALIMRNRTTITERIG